MEKPCEKCDCIITCDCEYCQKAFCRWHGVHIQDLDYNKIVTSECFEEREEPNDER